MRASTGLCGDTIEQITYAVTLYLSCYGWNLRLEKILGIFGFIKEGNRRVRELSLYTSHSRAKVVKTIKVCCTDLNDAILQAVSSVQKKSLQPLTVFKMDCKIHHKTYRVLVFMHRSLTSSMPLHTPTQGRRFFNFFLICALVFMKKYFKWWWVGLCMFYWKHFLHSLSVNIWKISPAFSPTMLLSSIPILQCRERKKNLFLEFLQRTTWGYVIICFINIVICPVL